MSGHRDPVGDDAVSGRRRQAVRTVQCAKCGALGSTLDRARFSTRAGHLVHLVTRVVGTEGSYRRQAVQCGPVRQVAR